MTTKGETTSAMTASSTLMRPITTAIAVNIRPEDTTGIRPSMITHWIEGASSWILYRESAVPRES